jgi:hypothetical protein
MLEGTDPGDALNIPAVPAVTLGPMQMRVIRVSPTQVGLKWNWPSNYAGDVTFGLRRTTDLSSGFVNVAATPVIVGDEYTVTVNLNAFSKAFYRLTLQLN